MVYALFPYEVFYAAWTTLIGVATIILAFISCCTVRWKRDPVRLGFLWFKCALALFSLGTFFIGLGAILACLYNNGIAITIAGQEALTHVSAVGALFNGLSYYLILLTTVELAVGFLKSWNVAPTAGRFLCWATYALVALLFILRIAGFAGIEAYYVALFNYRRSRGSASRQPTLAQVYNRLVSAAVILLWIGSLAALALTITVSALWKKKPEQRKGTTLLLVASIMSFIATTWGLASTAIFLSATGLDIRTSYIVEPILEFTTQLIALALLYSLGSMRFGGLWSTEQGYGAPMQTYGAYYPQQYGGAQYMVPAPYAPQMYGQGVQYQQVPNAAVIQPVQQTAIPPSIDSKLPEPHAAEMPNSYGNETYANHPTNHFANVK